MQLFQDYIQITRLHRPIGIWLLLFPSYVGLFSAHQPFPQIWWLVFLVGAVATRSAGCIFNDIVDRHFDQKVERTKGRPLARTKNPLSLRSAYLFLCFNLSLALGCLFFLPLLAGLISIVLGSILIFTYPWLKRWTYWPQFFLGFTMNFGMIVAAVSITGTVPVHILLLYLGAVFWTLGYDTIYGFQDIQDDLVIGVKSTAILAQKSPKLFLVTCYLLSSILWFLGGLNFIILSSCLVIFIWQIITLQIDKVENCSVRFVSNQWVGFLLWIGVIG